MGKLSRNKGKRYERELANYLSDNGFPSRRGQQFSGGGDSPDVVSEEFPFHIEAKRTERLMLYDAMTQSIRDAGDKPPCVIHRKNNSESMFTCRLSDLVALLNKQSWKEESP
tara:strand:+ start:487 stop:822 length:336 start_codon:yes stop_codon:yes gene_type:complete